MAADRRDAEVEAVAQAWWAHDPIAFDSLDERFRELQMTRAEAAIAALDAVRARSPQGEDHEAGIEASPTFWPGQYDREEIGPIGDGTPHARMRWFWDRMRGHQQRIAELTGWTPISSTYRFEAAIADAFDRLASPERDMVSRAAVAKWLRDAPAVTVAAFLAEFPDTPKEEMTSDA